MSWPLSGPETVSALIGCCGIVLPYLWSKRDARARESADKAVKAQTEAMDNKNKEIASWQQRYQQERGEHRQDVTRLQDRIDHLEDRLYSPKESQT